LEEVKKIQSKAVYGTKTMATATAKEMMN